MQGRFLKEKSIAFWKFHPALFYGIYALLGASFAIVPHWIYLIPAVAFLHNYRKAIFALLFMTIIFFYTKSLYSLPDLGEEKIAGSGLLSVDSVSIQSSPFHHSYLYQGTLLSFKANDGRFFEKIPCHVYWPIKKKRPLASSHLVITGHLLQKGDLRYLLKLTSWEEGKENWAEKRLRAHICLADYFKEHFSDKNTRTFLTSMVTGEIEERTLSMQFGRLGLQHILGVSGFQFVMITALLGIILRLFFSYRLAAALLICLLSLYFFFLGASPPAFRAWIAIAIFLIGLLWNKKTTALNALGVALILEIAISPITIVHIGFQLSFLCTSAILLLFPLMRRYLAKLIPVRPFSEVRQMSLLDQHGYVIISLIRESLALNLAVHVMSIPVLLSLFGKFPWMSLAYNLFFPFCAATSFLLTFIGMLIPGIHSLNHSLTKGFLAVATHPPALFDFAWRVTAFPLETVIVFLTAVIITVILLNESQPFGKVGRL